MFAIDEVQTEKINDEVECDQYCRRGEFQERGGMYMFKETLWAIHSRVQMPYHVRIAFHHWIKLAEEAEIPELRTMVKMFRDKNVNTSN